MCFFNRAEEVPEYDLAGLDKTWTGSQLEEPGPSKAPGTSAARDDNIEEYDSDMSDTIPQFDGANDEDGTNSAS